MLLKLSALEGGHEYYLLDPTTGETTATEGDFSPTENVTWKPLQPTGNLNEYWVATAVGTKEGRSVEIGRYDTKNFKSISVQTVKGLTFDSSSMWINEAEKSVCVVHAGDLIRFNLEPNID